MREWWLRTALVLQAPRAVFAALRDESPDAVGNRSEPVLLITLLAGMAAMLMTAAAGRLLDNSNFDGVLVAIWVFIGGSADGIAGYWLFGALLYAALKAFGSQGSYLRARHVLAFAAGPLALSFALLPVKLALFGGDVFRRGGSDAGGAGEVFAVLDYALLAWMLALLVIGVRTVHVWTWPRAVGAVALAAAVPAALSVAVLVL